MARNMAALLALTLNQHRDTGAKPIPYEPDDFLPEFLRSDA